MHIEVAVKNLEGRAREHGLLMVLFTVVCGTLMEDEGGKMEKIEKVFTCSQED